MPFLSKTTFFCGAAFDFDTISEGGANFLPRGVQIERFPISVNNYKNHAGFTPKKV